MPLVSPEHADHALDARTAREQVESTVHLRAHHDTKDRVGDTRSFANMEQTLTREYWGRFLIELLQNARDAWLRGPGTAEDGLLRIRLTDDPALVVCNEGEALTPDVVLHSISKFGESPKKAGEGIGHKGIGFKSVLELTHAPRIFSRADATGPFDLQIRFDPDEARELVRSSSPDWDRLVAELPSAAAGDGRGDRIPILRFPLWDAEPPAWLDEVATIDGRPFNTLICLPYDARFDKTLELTRDDFIARVRRAFDELSDEVVLLLGVFGRIVVEDDIAGSAVEIERRERRLRPPSKNTRLHEVTIQRNGQVSTRWWLFESSLAGFVGLEGDLAVGVRLEEDEDGKARPAPAYREDGIGSSGDCFHLFFPTKIPTHLPFLFHAYFEVDAGRKSFAEARAEDNTRRLDGLRALAVDAVRHLVSQAEAGRMDLLELPGLFARTDGEPDNESARAFRSALLADLDLEPWVVTRSKRLAFAAPRDLLIDHRADLPGLLPIAFPPEYLMARLGRQYAMTSDAASLKFLSQRNMMARGAVGEGLDSETLRELLHPGSADLWLDPDSGFKALAGVLEATRRDADIAQVLDQLKADADATVIPVVGEDGGRRLRAPGFRQADPDIDDGAALGAILARVSVGTDTPLAPPRSLGLDFLADGVLDSEQLVTVGAKLGIRPYQTDVIIDALAARATEVADAREVLRFVWRLLLREERGRYSLVSTLRSGATFEPGRWFWSKPDGNRSEADREELRRARALANLLLPAADGSWRPATELAFGSEWSEWLEYAANRFGSAAHARAEAYRDLEMLAPGPDRLVAGPSALSRELPLQADDFGWAEAESAPELPTDPTDRHVFLLHALLLRLGVWEIPPIRGFVNYRYPRSDQGPPWADSQDWLKVKRANEKADSDFARYSHQNVFVAEDYALAWPLEATDTFVRALSRGASFYSGYRRTELFCPQCRSHLKRYSSDGDTRLRSLLQWQLQRSPWVPTKTWGQPPRPTPPSDAWLVDELPDETRMQQSWMRYLPIATAELTSELARLAGVRSLKDADTARMERLLQTLRDQFEAGSIDPERRVGSFESQAFVGLHWRLYEQMKERDPGRGIAVLDRVGVLASVGRLLSYKPRQECRHDDGSFSAFRRYFQGQLPFVVLTKEQGPVADALGIERFQVGVERLGGTVETNVTANVRPFVHERAAAFLALQVFHPIGARSLQTDGREFPLRAERLRRLEVIQVDDLALRLSVVGTALVKETGAGRAEDMFLDTATTPAVLYHDLGGSHWEERFRQLAGPFLAALLDNPAYAATFQLLLQCETDADVEAFLEEQSISSDDLDFIRQQIDAATGVVRAEERRWWGVVLQLLGATPSSNPDSDLYKRETLIALQAAVPAIAALVFQAGGGESARTDCSAEGSLAVLEEAGVDLRQLHDRLVAAGDRGLRIRVAADRLSDWRRAHGREVAAVLARCGADLEVARVVPDTWSTPIELSFHVDPAPAAYLAAVIADLRAVGLDPDPDRLAGADASTYLAGLAGATTDELSSTWHGLFDEDERAGLERQRAWGWKRALRPVLVAARTSPGESGQIIRAEAATVDTLLPASPSNLGELAQALPTLLGENEALSALLESILTNDRTLGEPTPGGLREEIGPFLDLPHLDRVAAILQRGRRQLVDQVRRDIDELRDRHLTPTSFAVGEVPIRRGRVSEPGKVVAHPRRAHDQKLRDRLGTSGERIALAAVLDALLAEPRERQDQVIDELVVMVESVATGPLVDTLVANARAAQQAQDEDDRLEALVGFLHVAQVSDDFGFDLLGYLAPYSDGDRRPLFLEVKNAGERRFIASAGEWRRAKEQGDSYSFFVVLRGPGSDNIMALELVPDPGELLDHGQITLEEESWWVTYKQATAEAAGPLRAETT